MYDHIINFRNRLDSGESLIGTVITSADPTTSDALADSVDFLWYDQEHSPMSPGALKTHLMAARGKGCPSLVRVTEGTTPFIKPVLDSGACGVIAPQVKTVEEVRQVVTNCRYPNIGTRGSGALIPTNYYRMDGMLHAQKANDAVFAAVMIETSDAVEAIDEIVAVPGLDSVVIGPVDLSGALGVLGEIEHPKVIASIKKVVSSASAAGLYVGAGLGLDTNYALILSNLGVQWFQMGSDINAMIHGMDSSITDAKNKINKKIK